MPYGVDWEFSTSAGIASNGSPWNAPTAREGTQFAFLQRQGSCSQAFAVATAGTHAIAFRAAVRNLANHSHDFAVRVDGITVVTIKPAQMSTGQWRDFSITVNLQPGEHTLSFVGLNTLGGDNSSFVDDVRIADPAGNPVALKNPGFESVALPAHGFIYGPPAASTPGYRLDAAIATSGRTLVGGLLPATAPIFTVATPPHLLVNGLDVGTLDPARLYAAKTHSRFLWALPDGVAVVPGDDVELVAPEGWATVPGDFAAGMDRMPVPNRAGRTYATGEVEDATRPVGLDFGHLGTPYWSTYALSRNLRVRMLNWGSDVTATDARGYPTAMRGKKATAEIVSSNKPNFLDDTGIPAPVGLYAVGWGGAPSSRGGIAAEGLTVVERADLANPGDGPGSGLVRVFEVTQPKPGPWKVQMTLEDATGKPRLDYFAVYGPGDFDHEDGKPTVLEGVTDPTLPSRVFLDRTRSGAATLRFGDCLLGFGGSSACEPEHLEPADRFAWFGYASRWTVRYTQARPWTPDRSPYIYTPLFGEQYPATLATVMQPSTAGAVETIAITDAATAPVFEGLVLSIGDERCRVLGVSGSAVVIERGSERTTPAAHDPGQVMVSSRLKVSSLGDWKAADNQVTELVSQGPHRLRTGMQPTLDGDGWAAWPYADGSTCNGGHGLRYYSLCVFVTGPDTFVVVSGKAATHANTTLAAPVDLAPERCYSDMHMPEGFNLPHEFCASLVGHVGCDGVVNMPFAASDSYVDAVARIWRDATRPGQTIWVEYINEPWNWSYIGASSQSRFCWLLGKQPDGSMLWQVRRTRQMVERFKAVFAEAGRADDARGFINMQQGSWRLVDGYVRQALAEGLPPPDVAIAPYTEFHEAPGLVEWLEAAGTDQAADAWAWNLAYGVADKTGPVPPMSAHRAAVDATNAAHGTAIKCLGYECGVERAWPAYAGTLQADAPAGATDLRLASPYGFVPGQYLRAGKEWVRVASATRDEGLWTLGVERGTLGTTAVDLKAGSQLRNAHDERERDLVYHPQFRIAQMEEFALWQRYFDWACISVYSLDYVGADNDTKLWGMYHHLLQKPGRGDGRDGKHDNTACQARPGPDMKPATMNQDANVVSTRGGAFITWNQWARANR